MGRKLPVFLLCAVLAGSVLPANCGNDDSGIGPEEMVRRYFQYVNEENFEEFFNLFDPEVGFHAPFGFDVQGVDNIKPFYSLIISAAPDHVDTPLEILVSGNQAAVLVEAVAGTAGGSFTFYASDWFVFEEGKIKTLSIFFDTLQVAGIFTGN